MGQCWTLRQHSCKSLCPSCADLITPEIEVSRDWALWHHSYKTHYPDWSDPIVTDRLSDLEVIQRCAAHQDSYNPFCPTCPYRLSVEIDVNQRCVLPQHSCKHLFVPADLIQLLLRLR